MTDNDLLDAVKALYGLKEDKQLVPLLDLKPSQISAVRAMNKSKSEDGAPKKCRELPPRKRLECYDRLGYGFAREALLLAFPTETKKYLIRLDNERTLAAADRRQRWFRESGHRVK